MTVPVMKVPTPDASILTVPAPAPVAIDVTALKVPGALRSDGRDNVTAPVDADAVIWFAVPVIEVTPDEEVRQVEQLMSPVVEFRTIGDVAETATVPVALGNVIVLSEDNGSATAMKVSIVSAVAPSKTKPD